MIRDYKTCEQLNPGLPAQPYHCLRSDLTELWNAVNYPEEKAVTSPNYEMLKITLRKKKKKKKKKKIGVLTPPLLMFSWGVSFHEYTLKRENSFKNVLAAFWKGIYPRSKECVLPKGSTFFPFRVERFSEEMWCTGQQTGRHNSNLPWKYWRKSSKCIKSP